jgi:alkanesulfonate monooxygenase SsuD/methylene tetrahydromethanopterin reductase-like flavin-dependent oxidoreductase (luciferase family)
LLPRTFGVFYDFRNPAQWREPWDVRYRKLIEQVAWVESQPAFGAVSVSEHHFVDDGYTPSVMALCAGIATRTSRLQIATNIIQLPLHHPLRIAEDALTLDALSGGRFRLGVAVGYREQEFAAFGLSTRDRGARMDESLAILRAAFAGEPVRHDSRHWQFPEVTVTPGPIRPGGPEIWVGGGSEIAMRRAARSADGFMAAVVNGQMARAFHDTCAAVTPEKPRKPVMGTAWMIVAEDPEKEIAKLGDHMLYHVNQYIEYGFLKAPPYTDARRLVEDGFYTFTDANGALEILRDAGDSGVTEVHFFGVLPGEDVESATARLEYLASNVLRHLTSPRP